MWVLLDNYDSFTHILHHYLLQTGHECCVFRNDAISIEELYQLQPERIIISPGPETPLQAGICMEVVRQFHHTVPLLGICLGHQALGIFFGAKLVHAPKPMHGKTSRITHQNHDLFRGISAPFTAMRYHSLVLENLEQTGLQCIATSTDDNQIMVIVHEQYPCVGIQFHPESVGTEDGLQLLKNWAEMKF
jgi:anthranilate synthase/aminodeoxychorismate synthase-like glutamine amidotransferase